MSGANRTVDGQRQELVFCHECENEWYKIGANGLTCPQCHSDFTEIIEQDFDPRSAREARNPLHGHNPWADANDPDEDDIENLDAGPFAPPFTAHGSFPPGGAPTNRGPFQQNPFQHPIFGDFASMLQTIQGNRAMPGGFLIPNQEVGRGGLFRPHSAPGFRPTGPNQSGESGSGIRISVSRGPGFVFTTRTTTNTGGGFGRGQTGAQLTEPVDMNEIMGGLFANLGGQPRGTGGAQHPLATLFTSMFDPANAAQGDAVFSQEALDRVISQLMEQHPGGGAPGPASATAIRCLPKKSLSVDMLDENTGEAECSICMDNVSVGEEVTLLPCSHWFHFQCVEAWLKEHDTCPVCRRGITPKEGSRDTVRSPTEAPLHDEDPANLARRQSGTREHPFVVDESPTRERRRPSQRRHSSIDERGGNGGGGGGGITERVRNFFGGGSSSGQGGGGESGSRR